MANAAAATHSLHEEPTRVEKPHQAVDLEAGRMTAAPLNRQLSIQLTPEQFEQLYLQPGGAAAKGDLSKRFGNPTLLGLIGFLMCLSPFSAMLMGWAGTTQAAALVQTGTFYFLGAGAMVMAGLLEWIIGNTFPSTVFFSFGFFYGAFAFFQQPTQGIATALASMPKEYYGGYALYLAAWGALVFLFLIASLRTNVVFIALFFFLDILFWLLVSVYLNIVHLHLNRIEAILKAAGAFGFLTCFCGWYLLATLLFVTTGVPLAVPVGDTSGFMSKRPKQA